MTATQTTPLTFEAARLRLGVIHEALHPWLPPPLPSSPSINPFAKFAPDILRRPLLRLWDFSSGSQPDDDYRMLARDDAMQLFREEQRRSTLEMHLNHKVWDATPYISFSSSPTAIEDLAKLRRKRRRSGPLRLVAINPRVRQRKRLPILSVADEMKYYRIRDPYGRDGAYYKDHYVCLWEIAPDEVIGDWDWGQLETKGSWYEDVVLPAFHQHEEVASALSAMPLGCHVSVQQPENHSEMPEVAQLFAGLSIQQPTGANPRPNLSNEDAIESAESDSQEEHNSDSDASSTGEYKLDAQDHSEEGCKARDSIQPSDDKTGEQ